MKETTKQILWARHADGISLSESDQDALVAAIQSDVEFANECSTDLRLQNIIDLAAEPEPKTASFVRKCAERFGDSFGNSDSHAGIEIDVSQDKSDKTLVSLARIQKKKTIAKWSIAVLTLATAIIVGCFIMVAQNVNLPESKKSDPENSQETDAELFPEMVENEKTLPSLAKQNSDIELPDESNIDQALSQSANDDQLDLDLQKQDMESPFFKPQDSIVQKTTNNSRTGFAAVYSDSRTKWESAIPDNRIGQRKLSLLEGNAAIAFDNNMTLVLAAPVKIELVSADECFVESGWLQIESPAGSIDQFRIKTRDAVLERFENTQSHLMVDQRGSEVLLAKGKLELQRADSGRGVQPLTLDVGNLTHAFINNAANNVQSTPAFVIAHGRNEYLGQVGIADQTFNANSPEEFESIIENSQTQEQKDTAQPSQNQFQQFNRLFRELRDQFQHQPGAADHFIPAFDWESFRGSRIRGEFSFGPINKPFGGMKNFKEMSERFYDRKLSDGEKDK